MVVLTDASPRCAAVPGAALSLMRHQEAMVSRCIDIEQMHNSAPKMQAVDASKTLKQTGTGSASQPQLTKCGILDAPVGSGKTFCLLCLCLLKPGAMIVVPSHLYQQWIDAIDKFITPDGIRIMKIRDYADTAPLQYAKLTDFWKNTDIVLVSSLHFAVTVAALVSQGIDFKRIIIDEVDSILNMVTAPVRMPMRQEPSQAGNKQNSVNPPVPAHMSSKPLLAALEPYTDIIWLVSSSLRSLASKDPKPNLILGSICVPHDTICAHNVACDPEFIRRCLQLPEPREEVVTIDTQRIVPELLARLVSDNTLKAVYAEDWKTVLRELMYDREEGLACPTTANELAKLLYKGYKGRHATLSEMMAAPPVDEILHEDVTDHIQAQLDVCESQMSILSVFGKWESECAGEDIGLIMDKVTYALDFIKRVGPDDRILVFTEFPRVLDWMADRLRDAKVACVDLEGGTMTAMAQAIQKYKSGSARVLLAHSAMFSCGMNLENTTHVLIMHALSPKLREQVIGRGQRPGRKAPLTVVQMLYPGELERMTGVMQMRLKTEYEWSEQNEIDILGNSTPATATAATEEKKG